MDNQSAPLTRAQIAEFMPTARGVRSYEGIQGDLANVFDALSNAQFLVIGTQQPNLGAERIFAPQTGELTGTDGGANGTYTLGLADSGVTAGIYGSASNLIGLTVDAKGRATGVTVYPLNSDNVTEGTTNLFFTQARARASLSAGAGIAYNSTTGAIAAQSAGTYGAPSGTLSRTTFASYTAGATLTYSAAYTQSELTATGTRIAAIEAALQAVSRTLAALVTDMRANGNLS